MGIKSFIYYTINRTACHLSCARLEDISILYVNLSFPPWRILLCTAAGPVQPVLCPKRPLRICNSPDNMGLSRKKIEPVVGKPYGLGVRFQVNIPSEAHRYHGQLPFKPVPMRLLGKNADLRLGPGKGNLFPKVGEIGYGRQRFPLRPAPYKPDDILSPGQRLAGAHIKQLCFTGLTLVYPMLLRQYGPVQPHGPVPQFEPHRPVRMIARCKTHLASPFEDDGQQRCAGAFRRIICGLGASAVIDYGPVRRRPAVVEHPCHCSAAVRIILPRCLVFRPGLFHMGRLAEFNILR